MTLPDTPTLDKMLAVRNESQAIGEFLEWAKSQGLFLAEHTQYDGFRDQTLVVSSRSVETILADHFGIDLNAAESEKRAILASLGSGQ